MSASNVPFLFSFIPLLNRDSFDRFPAMGTEPPAGFHNSVTPGTMTFQTMATFRAAQVRLFHFAATLWTLLFFSGVSPDKQRNHNDQGAYQQKPEYWSGTQKPAAMPPASPETGHL